MPVDADNRFGGNNPAEQRDAKALENAGKLDEIFSGDIALLAESIRYMSANTRATLESALRLSNRE